MNTGSIARQRGADHSHKIPESTAWTVGPVLATCMYAVTDVRRVANVVLNNSASGTGT